MQYFVVVLVLAFVLGAQASMTPEQIEKLKSFSKECIAQTKVDEELVKRVRKTQVLENDPKYKEYLFCFNKKVGFQNAAGDYQIDAIKKKILASWNDEAAVTALLNKCLNSKKDTPQETAYEGYKCIKQNSPKDKAVLQLIRD